MGNGQKTTSVMNIPQPTAGVSKKRGFSFNWHNWRIWIIGFLIPVLVLGVAPLVKLLTESKYTGTGWIYDTFCNVSITIISFSMLLAAIFEFSAGKQAGKTKNRFASFLETMLLFVAFFCIVVYTTMITVEAVSGKTLLTERVFFINLFLFITSLILGTCSFMRGILWR